jgi:hypothetical protein
MATTEPAASMTLSVTIRRTAREIYEFISDSHNLLRWAAGLGADVQQQDEVWIVQTPAGPMKMVFAEKNRYGVADHNVSPPDAAPVYVPLRVLENGSAATSSYPVSTAGHERCAVCAGCGLVRRDLQHPAGIAGSGLTQNIRIRVRLVATG